MFSKKQTDDLCPHDKQPCIKERCHGWQVGPVEKTIDGAKQVVSLGECYIIWNLIYQKAIANRTDGTQSSIESFRNEVVRQNEGLAQLMIADRVPGLRLPSTIKGNGD